MRKNKIIIIIKTTSIKNKLIKIQSKSKLLKKLKIKNLDFYGINN